jgi:hypothetical protein
MNQRRMSIANRSHRKSASTFSTWAWSLGAILVTQGCTLGAADDVSDQDQASAESVSQPLYRTGYTWPNSIVPICYDDLDGVQSRLAFRAKKILDSTWGRVSNLAFLLYQRSIYQPCRDESTTSSLVHLNFWNEVLKSQTSTIGPVAGHTHVDIIRDDSVANEYYFFGHVIHEFGHVLGFDHEMNRPDNFGLPLGGPLPNPRPSPVHCPKLQPDRADPIFNGEYLTSEYDKDSVMSYCSDSSNLSAGDTYGVIASYGRKAGVTGFRIVSADNPTLALRTVGSEQALVQLGECSDGDGNCRWAFQDGMLVSAVDPRKAINAWGGARAGAQLRITHWCTSDNPDCTWTYSRGRFRSDNNLDLAMGFTSGAVSGSSLDLRNVANSGNLYVSNVMLTPHYRATLALNAWGGATFGNYLRLTDLCQASNPDCLWSFRDGMITSVNTGLAINAFGGAAAGTHLRMHSGCTPTNTDCTWTWNKFGLKSDGAGSLKVRTKGDFVTDGEYLILGPESVPFEVNLR